MKTHLIPLVLGFVCLATAETPRKPAGTAFQVLPVVQTDDKMHYLLPTTVEGTETHFLLDTGCGYSTVVSLDLAKALNKELGKASEMTGIGGDSKSYEVNFEQFKLGGTYAVEFAKTHVTDMSEFRGFKVGGKELKPQGMVGSLTLMALRGVLDTAAGHILVPPRDAAEGIYLRSMKNKGAVILPMTKKRYAAPYLTVTIEGKPLVFLIDTGATTNLIEPDVAEALGLEKTGKSGPVVGKGSGVITDAWRTKARDVMLGDAVKVPELGFTVVGSQGFKEEGLTYGGILGVPVLKALKAQLDFDTYSLIVPRG
jgi:predicted aspartyl protease